MSIVGLMIPGSPRHDFRKEYQRPLDDTRKEIVVNVGTIGAMKISHVM
jgi:hypothetical protein